MKVKLVVVGGDVKAAEIKLNLPVIIGRGRDATLTLPHPLVSRKHCELYEVDGTLMVRDLGSLNGTYVGSFRVDEASLPPDELLTVGTVNFRVVYSDVLQDDTEVPRDMGNSDSTHGAVPPAPAENPPIPKPDRLPPNPARRPAAPPIDRDTEWQLGNTPPRAEVEGDDDLSSLLDSSH